MTTKTIPSNQYQAINLDSAADNLLAFAKVRGSLDTNENVVFSCTGTIYSYMPNERGKPLFGFEMYNIAKLKVVAGGYRLLTREMLVYTDLKTGNILKEWDNPFTQQKVSVIPVWNDPVNQQFMLKGKYGEWGVPYTVLGDRVAFTSDIFLYYPSPLKVADYPQASRSDMYQAAELFQFFVAMQDLNNANVKSVPSEITWTRFSDFLPWMGMGNKAGQLCYVGRGMKLKHGFADLPAKIRDFVRQENPIYETAPDIFTEPNMTSWKYYKLLMEAKKAKKNE
jgi:hypothetical protein